VGLAAKVIDECSRPARSWEWSFLHHGIRPEFLELHGHEGVVSRIAFEPGTGVLAACSLDGTVRVWRPRQVPRYAERIDLAHMPPAPGLCQTGYLRAAPGREYLAYQDGSQGEFWIDLKGAAGAYAVEWFDTTRGRVVPSAAVNGSGRTDRSAQPRCETTPR
jgi:hypothetical protein